MQQLWLFNTLTKQKDLFVPIDKHNVRMYVCGPTVYDSIHIGNARPLIVFDILFRLLRYLYGAQQVKYVRNITDVDDKINARAMERYKDLPLNEAIRKLTNLTNSEFQKDAVALGCLVPSAQPRVTEHMLAIKLMIEKLLQTGQAYIEEDHVLFNVESFGEYGQLSRRSVNEMLAGARVEIAPYKRAPMDFVLWKPAKIGEPSWPSPGGINIPGRPGWHIECSAMSMATLLEPYGGGLQAGDIKNNIFDIHGGGIDLIFPHHENEIAQSRCSLNTTKMANFWLHNGYVQVNGQKMSKSENNFITVKDIIGADGAADRANKGNIARFAMLQTHYRSNFNWTAERYEQAKNELEKWQTKLAGLQQVDACIDGVVENLCDDLNTPSAITQMREYYKNNELSKLASAMDFLGLGLKKIETKSLKDREDLIKQRAQAIIEKDWQKADAIRLTLQAMGVEARDWKDKHGNRQTEYINKS